MVSSLVHLGGVAVSNEEGAGASPFLIGGGVLLLLLVLLLAVVSFGGGREHS